MIASARVARRVGLEDPGIVVVDEVLGMWLSILGLPFTPLVVVLGFLLFRVLDILKPYPAEEMTAYPVSKRVNSPRNNDPGIIDPLE